MTSQKSMIEQSDTDAYMTSANTLVQHLSEAGTYTKDGKCKKYKKHKLKYNEDEHINELNEDEYVNELAEYVVHDLLDRCELLPLSEEDMLYAQLVCRKDFMVARLLAACFSGLLAGIGTAAITAVMHTGMLITVSAAALATMFMWLYVAHDYEMPEVSNWHITQKSANIILDHCDEMPTIRPLFRKYMEVRGSIENWTEDDCLRWDKAVRLVYDAEVAKENSDRIASYL
jgi:hypothetical protein